MEPNHEEFLARRQAAILAHDVDSVIDSYADDAVVFLGPEPVIGKDAIRALFESIPRGTLSSEGGVDLIVSNGEYAFMTYHFAGMRGADTFHIRDHKIVMQSAHVAPG